MQPSSAGSGPERGNNLRRYGPIIAIVAVIAVIGAVVLLSGGDSKKPTATTNNSTASSGGPAALPTGAIPFSQKGNRTDLTFSDKYLVWDTTKFVFQSHQNIYFLPVHRPFTMDKQSVRDIIVVTIYVIFFGLNLKLFSAWQKRGTAPAAAAAEKPRTSRFGRPLRRERSTSAPVTSSVSGNGDS